MEQQYRRGKEPQFVDSDFAEALCEGESERRSSDRQAQRKTLQFCRQVQRALNLALADCDPVDGVAGLFVEEVTPAPDCGRLLVHVLVPGGCPVADAIAVLRRDTPRIRSEVATAITRKRAPELVFVPVSAEGASDE